MHFSRSARTRHRAAGVGALGHPLLGIFEQPASSESFSRANLDAFLPLGADTRQLAIELLRPVGALGHPLLGIFEQLDAFLPLGADTRQLAIELLRPVGALGHPLLGIFEQLDAFLPLGADTRQLAIELLRPVGALGHPLIEPLCPVGALGHPLSESSSNWMHFSRSARTPANSPSSRCAQSVRSVTRSSSRCAQFSLSAFSCSNWAMVLLALS